MFDWFCILAAYFLFKASCQEYRAIAGLVLFEFVAHQVVFILGIQLTSILEYSLIYLVYMLIQTITLYLMASIQSHIAITALIFINLGYNMLTISQYTITTIDFYHYYPYVVGAIMVLELIYLGILSTYVRNYRRKHGSLRYDNIDHTFCIRRRVRNGAIL